MMSFVSILDTMRDSGLLGPSFPLPAWQPWVNCAAALFGLTDDLSESDQAFIRRCLGGRSLPTDPVREAWLVIGRRGGKSRFAAFVAIYLACFRDYQSVLAPGERGVVMILAADRRQARVVREYISGLLHSVPMLEEVIAHETKEAIELTNRITIEIHSASYRSVRGYSVVGAICDEISFWRTEDAANPDTEILNALRPAMATVPDGLILCISSPYARRGELWKAYRDHYGKNSYRLLVWQADTRTMHSSVPGDIIDRAYAEDEAVASAEYGAQFRRDLESFVAREAIDDAVVPGRHELPPTSDREYLAFVDPSGGSSDSMTLAIAHADNGGAILDAVREVVPPFSPESVVADFASLLTRYRIHEVTGDYYGGEWPGERFRTHGITYQVATRSKSELYRELLPLLNSAQLALLDHPRLIAQLAALERRTTRGGRDAIDHPPGGHDDLINCVAGALVLAAAPTTPLIFTYFDAATGADTDAERAGSAAMVQDAIARDGAFWPE